MKSKNVRWQGLSYKKTFKEHALFTKKSISTPVAIKEILKIENF